jgi:hypothetical protein
MQPQNDNNLVVRQHERLSCGLHAEVFVAEEHAEKLVLTAAATGAGGIVPAIVSDLSHGGLGLRCKVFFPKGVRLVVRVLDAEPGVGVFPNVLMQAIIRVQRVQMSDRKPTYYTGGSFVSEGEEFAQCVNRLMHRVREGGRAAA